ncbi:helix-turn-helix transcriptional regulator [Krasilnikoviella flava]|uniref:helix-turn-helix transcriptional regulator n=1 Tax=Krasilnikoviella flava TaxID=526729 RepID=UPI002481D9B6|nr:helix-turn-helix transcriptional regulator [Krasilnikoviella flava]
MRRSSEVPLIARQAEVTAFRGALEHAAEGEPGVLLLGGDAGVGKTRLVTHLADVARDAGARVVVAHCVDLGDVGIPYLPFTEALTQLRGVPAVAEVVAERPALARLLDPAGGDGGSDGNEHGERLQLLDGVAGSLAAAGHAGSPLVLVVEDVHWADESTRDVLRFVVARLRSEHLLLVVTYRSDDVHRRHPLRPVLAELHRQRPVEHVELSPFTPDELREFTTATRGEPLDEQEFDAVRSRSDGNAFFAEELLDAGQPSAGLPWSLTDVLHTRLQRLDPGVQQLVRLAAVAGRQVDEALLRATAPRLPGLDAPGAADAALREAVTQQVLGVEGQHVAFRHALVAEALVLDLLPGERTTMHRAYLEALTADPALGSSAKRAHHALQGHDLPAALVASRDAALAAAELLAPAEELRHLEQVLSLWESVSDAEDLLGTDRVAVALDTAAAASSAGQATRAEQLARRAVDGLGDDPERQARLRHVLVRYLLNVEATNDALQQTALALDVLLPGATGPDGPGGAEIDEAAATADLAWTLAARARALLSVDRDDEAGTHAQLAVDVARRAGAAGAEADAQTTLAILEVAEPDAAAGRLEAARDRAADAGDLPTELRSWYNLSATHFYAGRLDAAGATLDEGLARARATGMVWSTYGVEMVDLTQILPYLRGDLTEREVPPGTPAWVLPYLDAGRLYAAVARDGADASARAEALRPHWDSDGQVALIAGGTLVDAMTWAGRYEDAVALAEEVAAHLGAAWSEFFLGRIWITALALAALAESAETRPVAEGRAADLLQRGDTLLAVAHETAERGRPRGGRLGPEGRAWLRRADAEHARLRAALTDDPADPALWEATVREFDFGYRYEVARSRFRWAQALRATGDVPAAEVEAAEALGEAVSMGAAPLTAAIHAWGRRARVPLPGTRRTTSVLTEREEEVLILVAQGLSNRQIGERLYISTKTVSVHVSNLLAKLGVSGRAEAVAVAHRRGLIGV